MGYIGNHLSASGGFLAMGKEAVKLGADTFAFFTRNPRGGKAKAIDENDAAAFRAFLKENKFGTLVAHAPYTMNLCSAKDDVRRFGAEMLADDMKRMEYIPGNYYNLHPGSHVGQGTETGIKIIAQALSDVLTEEMSTTVLLETMAGKGSEIGGRFKEIRAIIDQTEHNSKLGVCLDTCHIWDAGYDIGEHLDDVLDEFDSIIGLDRLKAIHLNDSMNELGAKKDRHQKLGEGCIGADVLKNVVCHPKLRKLPFVLETPNDNPGYMKEISMVKTWWK